MKKSPNTGENSRGDNYLSETLVSVSLFLVFLLVVITGILSYQKLNHIADTVKNGIRPDRKLILVKEIYNDLSEAENSVKSYSLTRNGDDMVRFYEITETTGDKVDELKNLVPAGRNRNAYFDELDSLVEKKFNILDRLLVIQDEFRVQQAMLQVMESIKKPEKPLDSSKIEVAGADTSMPATDLSTINPDTTKAGTPGEKENFFRRLFGRKNKKQEKTDTTKTVTAVPSPPAPAPHAAPPLGPDYSLEVISKQVMGVRQEALSKEQGMRQEEWELLQQDKLVMDRIRKLLAVMEGQEAANLLVHTKEAENNAREVKMIIATFGLAATLLLLLTGLVIFLYIRRNNEIKTVLNKARDNAEELAKAKELFLANMSHEIRTPMNIISGFLNQILDGKLEPGQRERFLIVKKSSDHLLHLLNDLLDLSKLQADKLELVKTNFSPAELITDLGRFLQPAADDKGLRLLASADPGLPPIVFGDPVRLRQILLNLAGNAIKFTDKGQVSIRAFHGKEDEERIRIAFEVTDTGIGINKSDMERIFGEFEQGSGIPGKNSEGAGLGLSITRRLVNLLGGEIHVSSKPGEGSTFLAEIPFRKEIEILVPSAGEINSDKSSLKGRNILVVDDEKYNRRLVRMILEKYGCLVIESESAEEAISVIGEQNIDVVLMDIRMPGMKGPEAASEIKKIALNKGKSIPVIIISAAVTKGDLDKFRQKGMDDFLLKPVEEDNLLGSIIKLLPKTAKAGIDDPAPVYDLSPLRLNNTGNDSYFREMVNLFLRDTDEGLGQLSGQVKMKQWDKAADLAHKISSPCRHLKAMKLYDLLKQIESQVKSPVDPESAGELLLLARREFDRIRVDIMKKNDL